ncbi:hypothetical protein STANM309S_04726 [Streptomyces tanashiensis]
MRMPTPSSSAAELRTVIQVERSVRSLCHSERRTRDGVIVSAGVVVVVVMRRLPGTRRRRG